MTHNHVVPLKVYYAVFAALMVGTLATVWVARVDLGPLNIVVAMSIAVAKATLVVLYFIGTSSTFFKNVILPRVAQWKDVLIAAYQLLKDDWMGFTHAYFPIHAFDEHVLRQGWAFA